MIKKLARYIGGYRKSLALVPFFVLLEVASELSIPLLMARVIDIGIPGGDVAFIVRTGLTMILLALVAIGLGILFMYFSTRASTGFSANLRDALFEKIQGFSFKNIDTFSTGSLVTRLTNDVNNLQMTLIMVLRMALRAPVMLVVAFFLAYSINAQLSIVLAVAIPILAIGIILIMRAATPRFVIMQKKIDALNTTLQENLVGIRVVKSYVREGFERLKFAGANDDFTASAVRALNVAVLGMPLMMLVMNGATLAVIWLGGRMVYIGSLGAGELISFLSYIMQILMSILLLSMVLLMSTRAQASAKRVLEVLDTEVDISEPDRPLAAAALPASSASGFKVEFRDVSFKYNLGGSGDEVLSAITFTAEPGQVVGIIGGTGTGKSSLVHLIPRLYDVTEGAVLVDGVDVRDYPLADLRSKIGMVLQQNTLFSGTIRENLLWGNENATQEEIEAACRDAQAHDFITSFPEGYGTLLGQGGVNLSGGQKQRLCIARAMLRKPGILILDDSTSAVDTATEARIRQSFYHNLASTTIFIIAQRISSVRDADQILVLDDGRIVDSGTHAELITASPIYREIDALQQDGAYIHG